jgi:hypothetical protein
MTHPAPHRNTFIRQEYFTRDHRLFLSGVASAPQAYAADGVCPLPDFASLRD